MSKSVMSPFGTCRAHHPGSHLWPGNIRELAHIIERSVIITEGSILQVVLEDTMRETSYAPWSEPTGKVSESEGAAATLEIKGMMPH